MPFAFKRLWCLVFAVTWCLLAVNAISHIRLVDVLNTNNNEAVSEAAAALTKPAAEQQRMNVQEAFIAQRLDHFRPTDNRTFDQRYFVSHRYVQSGKAQQPTFAFLCIGGEGPAMDSTVLIDSVHCTGDMIELAIKLYNAGKSVALYALEHRYYGKSYPHFGRFKSPVTNENLVYLSSRQALADIAYFVSQNQFLKQNHCWVTFGGSYPGMLAAWSRLLYPHLIHAAVSSSAPLQATLDFAAYNNHEAHVLRTFNSCDVVMQTCHANVSQLIQSGDPDVLRQIANEYALCNHSVLADINNVDLFLGDGLLDLRMQENDPSCNSSLCSIDKICKTLQSNSNSASTMADLVRHSRKGQCLDLDWQRTIDFIADPFRGHNYGIRSWLWQTCTEFGFYQTCEWNSSCPYGRGHHPLSQDLRLCQVAFGVAPARVADNVQATLVTYGGWHVTATRIVSVNGAIDPWSELAIQTKNKKDLPTMKVEGTSHHFWTHPSKDTDSEQVKQAREFIHNVVINWLDESNVSEIA